jgi:hypothetical protein
LFVFQDTFSLLPQPDLAASLALLTGATGKKGASSLGLSMPSSHGKMSSSASQAAAAAAAYEAVLADMNKMADLSAKVNSYSHEAKVGEVFAIVCYNKARKFVFYLLSPRNRGA